MIPVMTWEELNRKMQDLKESVMTMWDGNSSAINRQRKESHNLKEEMNVLRARIHNLEQEILNSKSK